MSQTIEQELNELRSLIAQSASVVPAKVLRSLETRLIALESRVAADSAAVKDPGEASRAAIMHALETADKGKPGFLSPAQIEATCNMTKSAAHTHVNELEKRGRVWIRKTHDPKSGRPCFFVYHPAAVRV